MRHEAIALIENKGNPRYIRLEMITPFDTYPVCFDPRSQSSNLYPRAMETIKGYEIEFSKPVYLHSPKNKFWEVTIQDN